MGSYDRQHQQLMGRLWLAFLGLHNFLQPSIPRWSTFYLFSTIFDIFLELCQISSFHKDIPSPP